MEKESFSKMAMEYEQKEGVTAQAVVFVDDIIGTGGTITENIHEFVEENESFLRDRGATVFVIVITGTPEGIEFVRESFSKINRITVDLQVCSPLTNNCFAFRSCPGIWENDTEYYKAKSLFEKLGRKVFKYNPLGFGGQGLLVVFSNTTPNNTLPFLHTDGRNEEHWRALFPRPTN